MKYQFVLLFNLIVSQAICQDPFICSYKCETVLSRVLSSCNVSQHNAIGSPIAFGDVNPFLEFDNTIKILLMEKDRPFSLIYNFKECSTICNSAAVTVDSIQFILYNKEFMNSMRLGTEMNKWAVRAVIAHEIGHHILGHSSTINSDMHYLNRQKQELQADYFSAFVIMNFPGATLENAMAGIKALDTDNYYPKNDYEAIGSKYPTISERLESIREAFESDSSSPMRLEMFKRIDSLGRSNYRRFGRSVIYREINKDMSMNNWKGILEKIELIKLVNKDDKTLDVLSGIKFKAQQLDRIKISK